ncbi:MMPL family transporter [Nocardioides houyundeii]|uniref:MMPL family transporter n=1 Tax=Nocardioides houyundeii TaxID=2045452 RepID=UPI000C75C99C|nr:MMPL family transporter [Nocardioides houyundeii]
MSTTKVPGASRVAQFISARRTAWLVALVPILLAGMLLGFVPEGERNASSTDSLPDDFDSTSAVALQSQLPEEDSSVAIVLWTAEEGKLTEAQLGAIGKQAGELLAEYAEGGQPGGESGPPSGGRPGPDSGGEQGPPEGMGGSQGPLMVADDGTAAYSVVPVLSKTASDTADLVTELRETLEADVPDGVKVQVTGPAGIQADVAAVFDGANLRLLLATASVVAILLIATYRSPVLWLIPLTVVGLADRLSAIVATQVLQRIDYVTWDESTVGILSVLVFGAGTNYALLLISRYRDELRTHESRNEAMARALTRTAEAVFASATTVFLGLMTLLLSAFPTTRGLGLACAIGIAIAASFVMVVLPAALVVFGRWIFWPRVPHNGEAPIVEGHSFWRKVGDRVARRPQAFVVGTVLLLGVMMIGLFQINTGLRPSDQFLETPEAISAADRLGESFPAGTTDPVQVLTRDSADDVLSTVEQVDGIASARVTTEGDGIAQIDAVLESAPGSDDAKETVAEVRDAVADFDDTYVGGGDAEALDESEASVQDRWVILPVILLLVLGALLLLLRSLVAPILLVATVVGTYAAAMGTSWWIFTGVFGFAAMDVGVPLLAFLFLVALGVDYNIFLVTRAREEAAEHGTKEGMLRALTATGGVITSAGILLAAVFAVLGVLPLVVLAQLGAIIFVGVLLDTLVVRTVLVPALALTLGDTFWWPRKVDRRRS